MKPPIVKWENQSTRPVSGKFFDWYSASCAREKTPLVLKSRTCQLLSQTAPFAMHVWLPELSDHFWLNQFDQIKLFIGSVQSPIITITHIHQWFFGFHGYPPKTSSWCTRWATELGPLGAGPLGFQPSQQRWTGFHQQNQGFFKWNDFTPQGDLELLENSFRLFPGWCWKHI